MCPDRSFRRRRQHNRKHKLIEDTKRHGIIRNLAATVFLGNAQLQFQLPRGSRYPGSGSRLRATRHWLQIAPKPTGFGKLPYLGGGGTGFWTLKHSP